MKLAYLLWRDGEVSHTFIRRELAAIAAEGADVRCYARERVGGAADPPGVSARAFPRAPLYLPILWGALRAILRHPRAAISSAWWGLQCQRLKEILKALWLADALHRWGADALHAHFLSEAAELAAVVSGASGIPFGLTAHARGIFCPRPKAAEVLARARWVVAISEDGRRELRRRFGVDASLVRCGAPASPRAPRPAGGMSLITVARCVEKKGLDRALDVASRLKGRGMLARWALVGDGPLRAGLEADARRRGLTDHVTFYGALPEAAVGRLYDAGVHAFVFTGRIDAEGDRDGIPVAMLDAMARGVPVVTTPVGGIGEAAGDPPAAALVEDRADAIADALQSLWEEEARALALGEAGARRVARAFDPGEGARRLLAVIDARKGPLPSPRIR